MGSQPQLQLLIARNKTGWERDSIKKMLAQKPHSAFAAYL